MVKVWVKWYLSSWYALCYSTKLSNSYSCYFWSNDKNLMNLAKEYKGLKLSQDNLFSTLLGYFDVKTSVYEPEYDLLNPKLKANP